MSAGRQLPRTVWILGVVSLLMDLSSEAIHALLPVFVTTSLGAGVVWVGLIEGIGQGTALSLQLVSGPLSDRASRRKPWLVFGYGLSALSKPLYALAPHVAVVLGARVFDRAGKGLRGAPRDALIADVTPVGRVGAAFGLRGAMDTVGAFAGPLIAIGLMIVTGDDMRTVFLIASIPAWACVVLIAIGIREGSEDRERRPADPIDLRALAELGRPFRRVVWVGSLFMLARFSQAFVILRSIDLGLVLRFVPVVLVVSMSVHALAAYPAGRLSDRRGPRGVLAVSLVALFLADVVLAWAPSLGWFWVGAAMWGLHLGLSEGVLQAMVAGVAPRRLRGTAYGLFGVGTGIAAILGSLAAGLLWSRLGPAAPFAAGGLLALVTLVVLGRSGGHPAGRPVSSTDAGQAG